MPMLQRYHPEAMDQIYSLSGFRDVSGKHAVMRAAVKIFQRPRQLGVGLCIEEAEVIPSIAEQTFRLCERIGYFGAFELEFIVLGDKMLLIDFNGRLYNQLAFDIARGMDLPRLVYAAATEKQEELARLVEESLVCKKVDPLVFCNSFGLSLIVTTQRMFRKMSHADANRWREWRKGAEGRIVDAIRDVDDPIPTFIDGARQVWKSIRHFRGFVKEMALRSAVATTSLGACL